MSTDTAIPASIGTATLAEEGVDFIIRNLSTMYTDPLYAVLREWVANAVDSVTTAHARGEIDSTDGTIHITLPDHSNPTLTVTDYGLGMDREHVFNYALNYGRSSKRDDTVTAGKFGLGLKSGLAVANQFTITSVRDGKQTMGFLSLGEADAGVENFCSEAQDTDLENQTTLSVAVTDNASTVNINPKIIRVLGGYDPKMFRVTSPAGTYSFDAEEVENLYRCSEDLINLGGTVYSAPETAPNNGSWGVIALVGGVTYPIKEGLATHEKQINDVIAEKLAPHGYEQYLHFPHIIEHSVICSVDGVDIPDNRDTLIFSTKTIDTLAEAYVAAILDAQSQAAEYFNTVTLAQAKHDGDNTFNADTPFIMQHTFAPQWHADAEIIARTDDVLRDRYRDELTIEHSEPGDTLDTITNLWGKTDARDIISQRLGDYAQMTNNATQPHPGFTVNSIIRYGRDYPDKIVDPGKALFITLDVSDRETTVTKRHPSGQTYTRQVYIDDKGVEHATAAGCIEALFKQYRVRINTWRRNNQFPTALIGPNPEIHIWDTSDFTEILSFDEFIEKCTTTHRAHLKAQREAKKARDGQQFTNHNVIATLGQLYNRDDQHQPYSHTTQYDRDITIHELERFADVHDIAYADLPIVTVTKGERNKLTEMISRITSDTPAVVPVVAFLRTTKTNIRKLERAGFTRLFTRDEFIQHCRARDTALREEFFASLTDTQRADIATFVWTDRQCPLLEEAISDKPLEYSYFNTRREHEDILAVITEQFADRGTDVTTNAGYVFIRDLIASAQRGYALLDAHVPNSHYAYVTLDKNDTTTWQFSGSAFDIVDLAQQPVTPDQPIQHAICGMLQAPSTRRYSAAPYIGLFTAEEYDDAYRQAVQKHQDLYTELERVLFAEKRSQLYDLLVRIVQLDW